MRAERVLELLAAVAAPRVEDVAREALGVDAHEHVLLALDLALDERDVVLAGERLAVGDGAELAVVGRAAARRRRARRASPTRRRYSIRSATVTIFSPWRSQYGTGRARGPSCRRRS